ncbi:MAG: hypothetical protein ACTHJJ_11580 [Intrasporangium sp.]|uniref:hypothetical protein n=1 Tax=Intrasporangium sp. TaxID=1925024 RepID=UPI003F7EC965
MNVQILTGDPAAYVHLLEHVTSTALPSSDANLEGMRIDVEYYLGEDSMLSGFVLHPSDVARRGTPPQLISASASWGVRAKDFGPRERASFLEWHWQRRLRYRYAHAHVVTATPDGHLHLHAVTQIDPDDFYVTLHVDVAPGSGDC